MKMVMITNSTAPVGSVLQRRAIASLPPASFSGHNPRAEHCHNEKESAKRLRRQAAAQIVTHYPPYFVIPVIIPVQGVSPAGLNLCSVASAFRCRENDRQRST